MSEYLLTLINHLFTVALLVILLISCHGMPESSNIREMPFEIEKNNSN